MEMQMAVDSHATVTRLTISGPVQRQNRHGFCCIFARVSAFVGIVSSTRLSGQGFADAEWLSVHESKIHES